MSNVRELKLSLFLISTASGRCVGCWRIASRVLYSVVFTVWPLNIYYRRMSPEAVWLWRNLCLSKEELGPGYLFCSQPLADLSCLLVQRWQSCMVVYLWFRVWILSTRYFLRKTCYLQYVGTFTSLWSVQTISEWKNLTLHVEGVGGGKDTFLSNAPRFPKDIAFLWTVPWLLPFVLQVRATCRWRWVWSVGVTVLTGYNRTNYSKKSLPQCHFVHNRFHMDWSSFARWLPRWEAGHKPPDFKDETIEEREKEKWGWGDAVSSTTFIITWGNRK